MDGKASPALKGHGIRPRGQVRKRGGPGRNLKQTQQPTHFLGRKEIASRWEGQLIGRLSACGLLGARSARRCHGCLRARPRTSTAKGGKRINKRKHTESSSIRPPRTRTHTLYLCTSGMAFNSHSHSFPTTSLPLPPSPPHPLLRNITH